MKLLLAEYTIRELQVKGAAEYPSHQESQNLIVGARVYDSEEEILSIFDTKKLTREQIMPVLVVVENNNDFAVRMDAKDIYLAHEGSNQASLSMVDVLLRIASKKKQKSTYSTGREILGQMKNKNMVADFEHKSFGEKLIPPHATDFGIVFFERTSVDSGTRLYLPSVTNLETGESLMFFEFSLE